MRLAPTHTGKLLWMSELVEFFNAHRQWVLGSQKLWPAQNRLFTCTSVRSQEAIELPNTP